MHSSARTIKAIFDRAHEMGSPAERSAYLDEVCGTDSELRRKVEGLLEALDEAGSFMAQPAVDLGGTGPWVPPGETSDDRPGGEPPTMPPATAHEDSPEGEGPGAQIGPYRLVEVLGEGGMGAVYLAEQEKPIRRQVALKLIKADMASPQVIARFEAERQALTLMDHPGIARVYDAGTTPRGRPYFVMELVRGVPLTRFCNDNKLTIRERLALFVTVCQALQHAHQKGIIHRDVKPSNILVSMQDGQPVVKVIDFGVAKAIDQPLTEATHLTQAGAIVGTLRYMSPEQADLSDRGIDTRTDVYALGVVLYELLTGTTPLDMGGSPKAGILDFVLRIQEEEAPRPSVRVASLGDRLAATAEARKTEPARLVKLLRRELDWIALKALEKDRNRRYESASDFARDVQRYLSDEPVEACPPSVSYRVGKFVRKQRVLVGAVGIVVVVLAGSLVWVNNARQREVIERENAVIEREKAVSEQKKTEKAEKGARAAFQVAAAGVRAQIRAQTRPEDEKANLHILREGIRKELVELGDSRQMRVTKAETELVLAGVSRLLGQSADAEAGYRSAISMYEQLAKEFADEPEYRNELARCYFDRASLLKEQGKRSDAEAAYRQAVDLHAKLVADYPHEPAYQNELAYAYNDLGVFLRENREFVKAETELRMAVTWGNKVVAQVGDFPKYRINLAASYHNLGNAVRDQGQVKASLTWYGNAIELLVRMKPRPANATHYLRNAYWDRANALGQLRQHAQASKDWQQALALEGQGPDRPHLRRFLAAALLEVNLKAQKNPRGQVLSDAAAIHARAWKAAKDTDEASLQMYHASRALELLEQAATAGYFRDPQRVRQLKEDPAFTAVAHADLQAFLKRLGAGQP